MEQEEKKQELTMPELIALINQTEGDFIISIELETEVDNNAKEK